MNQMPRTLLALVVLASAPLVGGCAAAVGAGAAAGAYEYQSKEQMEKLEEAFESGEITRAEYLERKRAIEESSAVY